jgi:acyl-CoA thioester hydrolase
VRFYETVTGGAVHFSWFFRYMEEAEHALWRQAGLNIHPAESDIAWPRVSTAFDYHRPLKLEQEFDVVIRIADMTKRTISYVCEISQDAQTIATGRLTIACVRRLAGGAMKSTDIPPEISACFSTHESA